MAFIAHGALTDAYAPAALAHAVLAVGIFPLIMGNILYFAPTLTRSAPPASRTLVWPALALIAGALAFYVVAEERLLLPMATGVGVLAVLGALNWTLRSRRACLGAPNPCLRWYELALASLLIGLVAITVGHLWPESWDAMRSLHLHMNLLGFVGLTALGTVQVLLPTVAGYSDAGALARLQRDWPYAAGGVLGMALGGALAHVEGIGHWGRILSVVGLILWLAPLVRYARALWTQRAAVGGWRGAAKSLLCAVGGLAGLALMGLFTLLGWVDPTNLLPYFFIAFLFPLVTGAVAFLAPLWIWTELPLMPKRHNAQRLLGLGGGWRGLAFLLCGVLAGFGVEAARLGAALVVAWFLAQGIWALANPLRGAPPEQPSPFGA
ncbi:hypothetical protein [Magnetofaba australis]|nr:hypothetical protein [Magnetofaba australis]